MHTGTAQTDTHGATRSPDQYMDANAELFERRQAIQKQIAAIEADENDTMERAGIQRLQRLKRQLEDVTTEVVRFNLGLVRSYCRRFTSNSSRDDSADFEAAGMLGLMRAIDSFDPSQGRFGHWAFKPIARPGVWQLKVQPANPIDVFVIAKLIDNDLSLSPEADRATLIRRVSFDLTGLAKEVVRELVASDPPSRRPVRLGGGHDGQRRPTARRKAPRKRHERCPATGRPR